RESVIGTKQTTGCVGRRAPWHSSPPPREEHCGRSSRAASPRAANGAAALAIPACRPVIADGRAAEPRVLITAPQAVPSAPFAASGETALPFSRSQRVDRSVQTDALYQEGLCRHGAGAVQEDAVEGRAEADGERAGEDGGLAEARDLDAGRIRKPAPEQPADGREEEVLVRAEASAEDDERDVGDGADRRDVERDPAGDLLDDLAGDAVA